MKSIELLAPAKNLKCGMAAIDSGADAVYIGGPSFGARINVPNTIDDIACLTDYAHQFGARIHVALNTILNDSELEQVSGGNMMWGRRCKICGGVINNDPDTPDDLRCHCNEYSTH